MTPFELAADGKPIAGGTTLVDLMKLGVETPRALRDLQKEAALPSGVEVSESGISLGAMMTMEDAANHPELARRFPGLTQSLLQAASPQIRNMATLGGNLLQRTRCSYFRDAAGPCNKRAPGSGCPAMTGHQRGLAVLGRGAACIANYAGDFAVALTALDACVEVVAADGTTRRIPLTDLYQLPGETPEIETILTAGDLIHRIHVPDPGWTLSSYTKIRDRSSYAFALASVALAVREHNAGNTQRVSIALGGLASVPWRCHRAEAMLSGAKWTDDLIAKVGESTFADAVGPEPMIMLGRKTLEASLTDARRKSEERHP